MSHYAKIDANNRVVQVIVAEQDFVDKLPDPQKWMKTSYNTRGGKHATGGIPFRKNYAGIGFSYDAQRDAFIPAKPFPSWILNESTCLYDPPIPMPEDGMYEWDENALNWIKKA